MPLPEGPDYFSDEEAEEHSFLRRSLRSIHLQRRAPEQLSFLGLYRYLRDMRNRGYHARPLWVELFKKPALSLAPLILVIFAIPCALSYGRKGAMVGVGLALAVAFVYYGCLAVFTALGKFGAFPPWLAALAPDILFGGVAVYWYLRIDT